MNNTYLLFADKATALTRSKQIATNNGCNKKKEDETIYWFSVQETINGEGIMYIPEGELDKLTFDETLQLKIK